MGETLGFPSFTLVSLQSPSSLSAVHCQWFPQWNASCFSILLKTWGMDLGASSFLSCGFPPKLHLPFPPLPPPAPGPLTSRSDVSLCLPQGSGQQALPQASPGADLSTRRPSRRQPVPAGCPVLTQLHTGAVSHMPGPVPLTRHTALSSHLSAPKRDWLILSAVSLMAQCIFSPDLSTPCCPPSPSPLSPPSLQKQTWFLGPVQGPSIWRHVFVHCKFQERGTGTAGSAMVSPAHRRSWMIDLSLKPQHRLVTGSDVMGKRVSPGTQEEARGRSAARGQRSCGPVLLWLSPQTQWHPLSRGHLLVVPGE